MCPTPGLAFLPRIAVACLFHQLCEIGESLCTLASHGDKAKSLGERNAIGASLKKFDPGADFPEDGIQSNFTVGAFGNRTFGQHRRASAER